MPFRHVQNNWVSNNLARQNIDLCIMSTMKTTTCFAAIFFASLLASDLNAQEAFPCGPDWMPRRLKQRVHQGFAGADFRPSCSVHDRCYEEPNANRLQCDERFLEQTLRSCQSSQSPEACQKQAMKMYRATRMFGGGTFRRWQRRVN